MELVFSDNDRAGRLDYVAAWYKKAAQYMDSASPSNIEVAFVSTNSIVQGEQVPILWKDLFDNHHLVINFAHRTFVWSSEASQRAHVHCVIIGFSQKNRKDKVIYEAERAKSFVKKYIGSYEFINRKTRYCLWLRGVAPDEYRKIPEVMDRLRGVADVRSKTKTVAVMEKTDIIGLCIRPDPVKILSVHHGNLLYVLCDRSCLVKIVPPVGKGRVCNNAAACKHDQKKDEIDDIYFLFLLLFFILFII